MPNSYYKYSRPRGSVHDVALALSLKDQGSNILCVSDATLYVLQNFMALDIEFKSRWAVEKLEHVYYPMSHDHALYSQWVDLVQQIQSEVVDMSCEIVDAINLMTDAIEDQTAKLTDIETRLTELIAEEADNDALIDDIEPILDGIGIILGAPALLGA
jgi:acyl-CoA hydrolase